MKSVLSVAGVFLLCVLAADAEDRLRYLNPEELAPEQNQALANPKRLNTLGCQIARAKPSMALDLRFHTGFTATIPIKKLKREQNVIHAFLRTAPVEDPSHPVMFAMDVPKPQLADGDGGSADFSGEYTVGPGHYTVDLLVTNGELSCTDHWQIEAKLDDAFENIPLTLAPGRIEALPEAFDLLTAAPEPSAGPVHVKILVNYSPAEEDAGVTDQNDIRAINAILRATLRERQFGSFDLVAFSSDQELVLQRQTAVSKVDGEALGKAVRKLPSGTITIHQLVDPQSRARFLIELLADELKSGEPDAVVVISPKVLRDGKIDEEDLRRLAGVSSPVFLLTYDPQPLKNPWQGALAEMLKRVTNTSVSTITNPGDLAKAILRLRTGLTTVRSTAAKNPRP